MAICPADMTDCKRKKKCLFGPNEGSAYDPDDPCCGRGEFDPGTCDCINPCEPEEDYGTVYEQLVTFENGREIILNTFGELDETIAVTASGAPICYLGGSTYVLCSTCPTCPQAYRIHNVRSRFSSNLYCYSDDLQESRIASIENITPLSEICCTPNPTPAPRP